MKRAVLFMVLMMSVSLCTPALANTVTFWTQSSTAPWLREIVEGFTDETGIEVELKQIGWGVEELYVAFAAGVMPDLFTHGGAALGTLAHQGLMTPLEPIIQRWDFADDIVPVVYDIGSYQGQQVGMTWVGLGVESLVYHADLFEEVGLSSDHAPERWDDLVTYGRRLVQRDENGAMVRSGLDIRPAGYEASFWFRTFAIQSGIDPFGEELASVSLLDNRIVDVVTFFADLINTHRINDRNFGGSFTHRSTAMRWDTVLPFIQLEDEAQYLRTAVFPYNQVPFVGVKGDFISLSSTARNNDNAMRLLEYILHPDQQYIIARERMSIPIFVDGLRWDWVQEVPAYNDFINLMMAHGIASTPHHKFFELRDLQTDIMNASLSGTNAPRVILEEANNRFLEILRD